MAAAKGNQYAVERKAPGRPVKYTEAIFFDILDKYAAGADICPLLDSNPLYPCYNTFLKWMTSNDELMQLYTCARQGKTEPLIARIHQTLDELKAGSIEPAAARVMIDTWKWEISKYYPKLYGDKLDLSNNGESFSSILNVELSPEIMAALVEKL